MKSKDPSSPPQWPLFILRYFLKKDYLEEIEGDMEEIFEDNVSVHGSLKAKRLYALESLKLLRPALVKNLEGTQKLNYYGMIKHNFLLTFRNFKRYKSSFLINLVGLSTGLACTLLIYLWVNDELSFDKFHEKDKHLYQVMLHHEESGQLNTAPDTPARLSAALEDEVAEIVMATEDSNPQWFGDNFSMSDGESFLKVRGKFAGEAYFDMFSFDFIDGNNVTALKDLKSIVISETLAKRVFDTTEGVVGKTLEWKLMKFTNSAIVTGIFKDIPSNSTNDFDFVIPYEVFANIMGEQSFHWTNYNALSHVLLSEGTDVKALNERISGFIKAKSEDSNVNVELRPFSDRHLYNQYENGVIAGGKIEYVKLFSIIALFILGIACINFMNLSTAKSSRRIKEVGVKKSLGARRGALVFQYLCESFSLTILGLLVAIGLVALFLPQFNAVTGKELSLVFNSDLIGALTVVTLLTGLVAGSYPAIYLSGFRPSLVLKGRINASTGEVWARRGLVIFQFALSIVLIVSVIVVYKQISFIQTTNLGFDKDNVIIFPKEGKVVENMDLFLAKVKELPGVVNCSASAHKFTESGGYTTGVGWDGKDPSVEVRFANATIYYDLLETLGIEVTQGRSFSREFGTESQSVLFNQTAIDRMGLGDNPVGETVKVWGHDCKIIGVVKDFHYQSLHEEVLPVLIRLDNEFLPHIMVKINAGTERRTLEQLETLYSEFNPGFTLQYSFMDQQYQAQYVVEQRVATISEFFAGFAILISCLGLFGLAAFTAERRLKEIGIRKILGSGNMRIVVMLAGDFTKMVLMAILIALPASYFLTSNWLEGFAYRIGLEWWFFVGSGILALFIAWLTVGLQTLRVANINPAQCLRSE